MKKIKEKIINFIDKNKEEMIADCSEIIKINTVNPYSGDSTASFEQEGQIYLKEKCEKISGDVKLLEVPNDIYKKMGVLGPEGRKFEKRPNLVSEFIFGEKGKTAIINGHMDTVGAANMAIDPFSGEIKDGKIWGRGTVDCKGTLISSLFAIRSLQEINEELNGKIIYQSVVDEECNGSGAGTLGLILAGYTGDFAIVGDGMNMQIVCGCDGIITGQIKVFGKSAHASSKYGVNAIDKAIFIKEAIDQFKKDREKKYTNLKTNLGVFQSGSVPSMVPGEALLGINICYHIEEAEKSLKEKKIWGGNLIIDEFEQRIKEKAMQDSWIKDNMVKINWIKDLYPFKTDENCELVNILKNTFKDILNKNPEILSKMWFDAAHFSQQLKIPVIGFSPGDFLYAHSDNEHIEIEDLINHSKILALSLYQLLKKT